MTVTAVVTEHGRPTSIAFVLGGATHVASVGAPWPIQPNEFGRCYVVATSAGYFVLASSGDGRLTAHPEMVEGRWEA